MMENPSKNDIVFLNVEYKKLLKRKTIQSSCVITQTKRCVHSTPMKAVQLCLSRLETGELRNWNCLPMFYSAPFTVFQDAEFCTEKKVIFFERHLD